MFRQLKTAEVAPASPQPAPSVTLDADRISDGDTIIAWHGAITNPANLAPLPPEWTTDFTAARMTFQGFRGVRRTWNTGDSLTVSMSTTVANTNQRLLVFVLPGAATFDAYDPSDSAGSPLVHGPTPVLGSGAKLVMAGAQTTADSGGFGSAPAGYEETWRSVDNRLQVIHKFEAATTDTQSATQTWTAATGASGAVATYLYTPLVVAPGGAQITWDNEMPIGTGDVPTPFEVVKLPEPMFASQLGFYLNDYTAATNLPQSTWDTVASRYRYMHPEGHDHSRLVRNETDGKSAPEKFTMGRQTTHFADPYTNGSYVTQGAPWLAFRPAAHAERHHPLGISVLSTSNGMTLNAAADATATTIRVNLPTSKPTNLPASHPSGIPSTFWPIISSTLEPGQDTFSKTTSEYVSWFRIGDEVIGLPKWSTTSGPDNPDGPSPQEPTGPNPDPMIVTNSTTADRTITTANGESVVCRYPTSGGAIRKGRPLVIIGPGLQTTASQAINFSSFLAPAGYIMAVADYKGSTNYLNNARLVTRVIDAVLADPVMGPAVLPERIGYTGGSNGGISGLALLDPQVRDNRIRCIVSRMSRVSGATPKWDDAPPILFMLGQADTTIRPTETRAAYNAATAPKGLIEVPGAGHDMIPPISSSIVRDAQMIFFERFLLGDATGWPADMQTRVDADPNALVYQKDWTLDGGSGGGGGGVISGNYSLNAAGTVATINNVVRGLWRTERQAHTVGAKVRTPDYIGSDAATEADKRLSGNPIVNSTGGLRYALAYYDQALGGTSDGLQPIADVIAAEQQALNLGAGTKTVTAVAADGTHTSTAHGFSNGQRVEFGGANMAGGTRSLTPYYVRDVAANTFKVARTVGGPALTVNQTPVAWAKGTWVLQQINDPTAFANQSAAITAALGNTGVVGFSMRMPWDAWEQYPDLINQGKALADAAGKKFMFRFMAGEHTPSRIFAAGAYSYQSNLAQAGQPARMATIPKPFSDTGVAGNPVFEREYDAAVGRLAAWSRDNNVRIMHLPWYGWKWSEFMNGPDLVAAAGYSWNAALEGARQLALIAKKHASYMVAAEYAVSGHYDDPAVNEYNDLTAMLSNVFGYDSPLLITQGNNMSDQPNTMGKPAAPLKLNHAKQSVSSTVNNYDWAAIYTAATNNDWAYIEFYTPQFKDGTSATLKTQAATWLAAQSYTAPAVTDMKVARLLRDAANPVANGTELDVTAGIYNNSDPYGTPIEQGGFFVNRPHSYVEGTTQMETPARQRAKRAPLQTRLTALGLRADHRLTANNFLAGTQQMVGDMRLNMVRGGEYDAYLLEHATMEPSNMVAHFTQYAQFHAENLKAIQWTKDGEWKGGAYSNTNRDAYIRMNYAAWLLTWRVGSTVPILMGKFYESSVSERPSDRSGHEVFYWDFGVPTTQLGSKPVNPTTAADLFQPATGLYMRTWTKGIVLANTSASARSYTLTRPMLDALSEVNRNGVLTRLETGAVVTVPAYDAAFLLNA